MRAVISLSRAALRLGLGYQATRDMLLRGELRGGIDARGRYVVDAEELERLIHEGPVGPERRRKRVPAA
jgi:hypothetical protein